jgi:outer membrane immunogenic protein
MKRVLVVAVASIIAATHALAADLPVPAGPVPAYYPVATVYDWGGGYIGVNGGYGFGQSQWGSDPLNPSHLSSTGNFNVNGGLFGITAGVSGQFGAFVLGAEGDFDWQDVSGTSGSTFCTSLITSTKIGAKAAGLSCKTASNWVTTFRGRFGYAWDRMLFYGTAAGAGIEVALAEHWTFKVEYLFVGLANALCNHGYSCGYNMAAIATKPASGSNTAVQFDENLIRVGVNFKFGH